MRRARQRALGVLDQLGLDVGVLGAREQFCGVEAGRRKGLASPPPDRPSSSARPTCGGTRRRHISRTRPRAARRQRARIRVEGVDRKERVPDIGLDLESLRTKRSVSSALNSGLFLTPAQGFGRRPVVGGLEDAAEQDRHIFEIHADARLDRRDRLVAEEGVGAAEIEQELRGEGLMAALLGTGACSYMIFIISINLARRNRPINPRPDR